jgi:hypothetical protein
MEERFLQVLVQTIKKTLRTDQWLWMGPKGLLLKRSNDDAFYTF